MDEYQWSYDNTMSQEVDMDYENEQECGVNEPHVDCSDAFNTSQVIMFIIVSDLMKCMCCRKLKLSGLRCRSLVPEMMFCSGLNRLLMKTDLLQSL